MNNNNENPNEPLQELPEADYREWMIIKAFTRCFDDCSNQARPFNVKTFIETLREIKYKSKQ